MSENNSTTTVGAEARRASIDWTNPAALAIDGFTVAEVVEMVVDSLIPARCTECGAIHRVETAANGYDCAECYAPGAVTSPLVKLGFV